MRAGGSDPIREVARLLAERRNAVALTGAGISVESGIPSFRGAQGMWAKYDPMEYATLHAFMQSPRKVWEMLSEMLSVCGEACPTRRTGFCRPRGDGGRARRHHAERGRPPPGGGFPQGHRIPREHGRAGLRLLLEAVPDPGAVDAGAVPLCDCGEILKPNVVLFGEPIPWLAQEQAEEEARTCGVLLVIGTSAQVSPACDIPRIAKESGAAVVEINPEETSLTANCDRHPPAGERLGGPRRLVERLRDPDRRPAGTLKYINIR